MKTGISENQINKLIEEGFFDKERNIVEIIEKFDTMGYTINRRQKPRIAQLLTQTCRKGKLERRKLPKFEWKIAGGRFVYKKKEKR